MNALSPYGSIRDHREDPSRTGEQIGQPTNQPFISLLELVREIYQVLFLTSIYSTVSTKLHIHDLV